MIGAVTRHLARLGHKPERGFTLIELLVVIIILGILAAVVVFAVRGVGDKGQSSALAIDARTIRTAQEAFCAREGRYGTVDELVAERFLSDVPSYHQTDAVPAGSPDASGNCTGAGDTARGSFLITCNEAQAGCGSGGALRMGWREQAHGITGLPSGSLQDIFFIDHDRGWAVGGNQITILATTDGGASWVRQTSPLTGTRILSSVDFVDANRGWAAGTGGTLLATSDGGANWVQQILPAGVSFRHIDFIDANRGWGVTTSQVLTTADGGATWTVQFTVPSGFSNRNLHFIDANRGWVSGTDGGSQFVVHATIDGGTTWTSTVITGSSGSPAGINFVDATHGWVVGGSSIYATADGGATWILQPGACGTRSSVYFVNRHQGWNTGSTCAVNATADGGTTWNQQGAPVASLAGGVHFVDAAHGWAVGSQFRIVTYQPL